MMGLHVDSPNCLELNPKGAHYLLMEQQVTHINHYDKEAHEQRCASHYERRKSGDDMGIQGCMCKGCEQWRGEQKQ